MPRIPFMGSIILLVLALFAAPRSEAEMRLCNDANVPVYTALGYNSDGVWRARGWWRIWPNDCATLIEGSLDSRYYYVRATALRDEWVWGDEVEFCVSSSAFNLRRESCNGSGQRHEDFFKIDTGDNDSWTQRLTCTSCALPRIEYEDSDESISVDHVVNEVLEGVPLYVPVHGKFRVSLDGDALSVHMRLRADLSHLQANIGRIVGNAAEKDEECGERVHTHSTSLQPSGESARFSTRARYEKWLCTSMDVPQVKCTDTWIRIGPMKTKGVPKCKTWIGTTRTSKNKLFQQSGEVEVLLSPRLVGKAGVKLDANVTRARLDGLGQVAADLFDIDLKRLAQRQLDRALGGNRVSYAIPASLKPYAQIDRVAFDGDDGDLSLVASGAFSVTGSSASSLCRKFWSSSACDRFN
jgi:uncharacterized membrane protein